MRQPKFPPSTSHPFCIFAPKITPAAHQNQISHAKPNNGRFTGSDVLISSNSGMTGVVNKFQHILGIKVHERHQHLVKLPEHQRPIVFISHMEHHSNQTSWLETLANSEKQLVVNVLGC